MGGSSGYFSGLNRPDKEHMNLDPCPYMRSASFTFLSSFITTGVLSTPCYAGPTGLHKRHLQAEHGEPARTGPLGSRSAAAHTNGRWAAIRVRPPLPSRTASTASSGLRRGPELSPRAACSEPLDR